MPGGVASPATEDTPGALLCPLLPALRCAALPSHAMPSRNLSHELTAHIHAPTFFYERKPAHAQPRKWLAPTPPASPHRRHPHWACTCICTTTCMHASRGPSSCPHLQLERSQVGAMKAYTPLREARDVGHHRLVGVPALHKRWPAPVAPDCREGGGLRAGGRRGVRGGPAG